jgi:hypothetical protein
MSERIAEYPGDDFASFDAARWGAIESESRLPGAPPLPPDEAAELEAERNAAVDAVTTSLGALASPAVVSALHAAYSFGRLDAIRYARRVMR